MSKILILLHPPECAVCGQEVEPRFLGLWNGTEVCKYCIRELNEEVEKYVSSNHN